MRKKNKNGIPELAESIDELDQIYGSLETRSFNSKLSPKEQAIIDIYRTIGGIEGNGLHQFWNWEDADRIIASFRFLNENEIADALDKTRWTISILERGTDKKGHYKFTKKQEEEIDVIEERVYELFIGLPTKLLKFAKQNKIEG